MHLFLNILIALSLLAVAVTLAGGVYSLFRGGAFAARWSNKLMRLRVGLQFVAIGVLLASLAIKSNLPPG